MKALSTQQLMVVEAYLRPIRITTSFREEMLDHLCCAIECEMAHGASFERALATVKSEWPPEELRRIQHRIRFTTKTKPMLMRIATIAAIVGGLFFLSPFSLTEESMAIPTPSEPLAEALELVADPPTGSPLPGRSLTDLHSGFGMRKNPFTKQMQLHRGIDYRADLGTPVVATADGKVIFAGENGDYGIQVKLAHEDGYITVYSHLQATEVEANSSVKQGQPIAKVGSTGLSTGPHLHYEVLKDNQPLDPLSLLDRTK